jgi:hypothetical protein
MCLHRFRGWKISDSEHLLFHPTIYPVTPLPDVVPIGSFHFAKAALLVYLAQVFSSTLVGNQWPVSKTP